MPDQGGAAGFTAVGGVPLGVVEMNEAIALDSREDDLGAHGELEHLLGFRVISFRLRARRRGSG